VGCSTQALIGFTVLFFIVDGVWWLVTGHHSKQTGYVYLWLVAMIALENLGEFIVKWRDDAKETAETVKKLEKRFEELTELIEKMEYTRR
jgi:hypothetical protein